MHFTETSRVAATSGSPPGEAKAGPALRINKSRPWDYDTEDSGVDSVSSLAGLEVDNSGSVEYSAVIVNKNQVNNTERPRKSFLHTVYGGVQTPSEGSANLDCNANKNPTLRKHVQKMMDAKRLAQQQRPVETAKNHFLHSLLDNNDDVNTKAAVVDHPASAPAKSTSSLSSALDFIPELVQLLDTNRVIDGGLIELIGRDGTRASVRVTLAPPTTGPTTSNNSAVIRKNSFNSRLHRNSKRSSQRRPKPPQEEIQTTTSATTTPAVVVETAKNPKSMPSSGSAPSLAGGGFMAQRPRSVRRRPSSSSKKVPSFSVSMAIPPSKVAVLASKFNSLINESRRGTDATSAAAASNRDKNLSPAGAVSVAVTTTTQSSSAWSCRLVPTDTSTGHLLKRMTSTSSVKPSVDTIPEIVDPPEDDYSKPRRKSYDLSTSSGRLHSAARPLPSDPVSVRQQQQGQQSVYGTVKNIVKQAIKKFEKLDGGNGATVASEPSQGPSSVSPVVEPMASDPESSATVSEGIAPNSSFLWRDHKSMQNLIYEATSFNERAANRLQPVESNNYYEMGSSIKYDTLGSGQSNAYDTLQHGSHHNKSSSSSSSGYDEIRSPDSLNSNPSDATASSVKYDDVKQPPSCATYDELSYLGRRPSNGYDELRSPPSSSSSGGYIDPGSSSALGYERILPPKDQQGRPYGEQTSDEDGSTLRYEECRSPSAINTVTALPAIVCEDQLDSISYLYDDIRAVGRMNEPGTYGGSNHSYEPIYAHLGEGSVNRMEESTYAGNNLSGESVSDSSGDGIHEVCSYKLTQMGNNTVPDSPAPSLAGTSISTRTGTERRSETSDDWIDISDPEEPAWTVTRIRPRHDVVNASFVRRGHRASRRKMSIPKATQQSWSQTMRTLVKNGFNKAATLSRRTGKEALDKESQPSKSQPSATTVASTKSSARRLPSAETEASGTGSSQTWEDYGDSDGDEHNDDHHYEALYEVINPRLRSSGATAASTIDHHDDSFDDSFDSDDAFEEVVVRGLDATSDTSRERPGSRSGSERSKESEDPSLRSGQLGISRFADLAGQQMRRLRRNWSTTKTDITKSITRIKKKSTASVADLGEVFRPSVLRREVSPEKSNGAANRESFSSSQLPLQPEVRSPDSEKKKKGTWAMRQIRRRMTVAPQHSGHSKKEASTFYLTLTIEQAATPVKSTSKSPDISQASSPEPLSTSSPIPPLVCPTASSKVPVRPKRTSSASSILPQTTVRPKTAPPAPPVKSASGSQIFSSETTTPPAQPTTKRPLTRLATAVSESRIAVEQSQLVDEYQSIQYSGIAFSPSTQHQQAPRSLSSLSTPYSRLSLASHLSGETYIGVGELASAPEQKRSIVNEEIRHYLDLQTPSESEELYISSHFADEPLYQFYTAAIIERATQNQGEGSEEDDYEVIGEHRRREEEQLTKEMNSKLPTAMELVMPSSGRRTLWCELPQVINSGLLETIPAQQRKLQEAMFELITSEASYLRSLNVLTTHFIQSQEFSGDGDGEPLLSKLERHTLFSDIIPVRECSEALLADLEKRWQENVFIREICDILLEHASKHFKVYIKYCTHQLYQERMLRELKETKPQFVEVLRRLESSPVCQSLAMHSFLMLPMQRITRLPLLVDAIFHRLDSGTPEYDRCRLTLATLNKIVQECNEGARKAERIHEMLVVSNQLDFADVKAISIVSASRWLVKKGEMQRLMWRDIDARLTFGRKIHKQTVYVFLFTDLLVITKKKGEENYAVLDYCPRNMVQVDEHVRTEKPIGKPGSELGKNLILMTMLQNHENKTVEMILSCSSESDRTRWLEAVTPRTSDNPEEKIYEEWDCPQVQAIHPYVATQPDELSLEVADVVNVLRKMADGWYQGERMRDDQRGWFPGNYTVEIASSHVRARNLRQRYRLLALSGNFIEEQARRDKEESKRKSKKLSITE